MKNKKDIYHNHDTNNSKAPYVYDIDDNTLQLNSTSYVNERN